MALWGVVKLSSGVGGELFNVHRRTSGSIYVSISARIQLSLPIAGASSAFASYSIGQVTTPPAPDIIRANSMSECV